MPPPPMTANVQFHYLYPDDVAHSVFTIRYAACSSLRASLRREVLEPPQNHQNQMHPSPSSPPSPLNHRW